MRAIRVPGGSVPIIGLLIGTAWAALWLWAQGPYGRYLDHGRWTEIGVDADICRALPKGDVLLPGLLYIGGLLITAAMMLPTVLPLLRRFERLTAELADWRVLVGLLIAGYLLVWAAFGFAAHLLHAALHLIARQSTWLEVNGWVLGAIVLATAGAFQFTRLKYRCLDRCRSPFSFITQYWRGRRPKWNAFVLGGHHGGFCVGCCWAIMLLMFVVGTGNVGYMLVPGAIMALEKNAPWGRRLRRPLGFALLSWAAIVTAINTA
jgi:predicted metal-binding membrane protein